MVHQMGFQERLPYRQLGTYLESQIFTCSAQMENVTNLNETVDPSAVPTNVGGQSHTGTAEGSNHQFLIYHLVDNNSLIRPPSS